MTDDATIDLPEPEPTGPAKDQMYQYRGETVSIAGMMDWIIHRLADDFTGSRQPTTTRRWDDIKEYLRDRDLTDRLQPELHAIAEYFKVRELAAHAATVVVQVGDATQLFRLYFDGPTHNVESVTVDDLKREADQARQGYEAAQSIGRALDDDQPAALRGLNAITKALLIGRI